MILRPTETFSIVWQVSDPQDANTYYPQAVFVDSRTGNVLATINLTSAGGQRYTGTFQVPVDSSGLGFWIDLTLTVYTDSGHTTKSGNYNVENRQYLVSSAVRLGSTAGGDGIDYGYLAKTIETLLGKQMGSISIPKYEKPKELERLAVMEEILLQLSDSLAFHGENINGSFKGHISGLEKQIGLITETLLPVLQKIYGHIDGVHKKHEALAEVLGELKALADGRKDSQYSRLIKEMEGHTKGMKEFTQETKKELRDIFSGIEIVNITKDVGIKPEKKETKQPDNSELARRLMRA